MYSTCVSEWRVPLMKVTEESERPVAVAAEDLVGAEAVLHRHHVASAKWPARRAATRRRRCPCSRRARGRAPAARGSVEASTRREEVGAAGDAEAVARSVPRRAPRGASSTETSATCARWPAKRLPIDAGARDAEADHALPPPRQPELAAAGQPRRAEDEHDRHHRADRHEPRAVGEGQPEADVDPVLGVGEERVERADRERADDRPQRLATPPKTSIASVMKVRSR